MRYILRGLHLTLEETSQKVIGAETSLLVPVEAKATRVNSAAIALRRDCVDQWINERLQLLSNQLTYVMGSNRNLFPE
jgi:hypothetical protein